MNRLLLRIAFVLLSCNHWPVVAPAAEPRPNIILMIADDMSWNDCGAYGHPRIHTPNIDALASQGMRFDQAFLTISSCSPSRASLITGRYPHRTDAEELHWPLPAEQITFTELLREAGYWCGAAGKWHLGDAVEDRFDSIFAADTSGFQLPTGTAAAAGKFVETQLGDQRSGCADWVRVLNARTEGKPFFLWLAALDPHRPYDAALVETNYTLSDVLLPPYHPDHPAVRADYVAYYQEITRLDRFVGEVVDQLEQQQLSDNTVVMLISDNGRPFPRDKTTIYDSGIRTPLIVRWPKLIAQSTISSNLVSSVDIGPTILEIAGVPTPETMDGISFLPQLHDPRQVTREYVFAEKNWHDFEDHARAARDTRFKYIRNYYHDLPNTPPADAVRSPTYQVMLELKQADKLPEIQQTCFVQPRPQEELYDTVVDPHEINNLAHDPQHRAELVRLRNALQKWEQRTGDVVPTLRTADEFDRVTGKPTPARRRPRWSKKEMVAAGLTAE